jgi:glycine cleavage system transcriptional repressor
MRANIVFTLTGTDRIGIVEDVTGLLLDLGGNVETSTMSRLGGEFAMLMLVSLPAEQMDSLAERVASLTAEGFKVTTTQTDQAQAGPRPGWRPYRIEVQGADHEGIIHEIAGSLAKQGINIEEMETVSSRAPISGSPLFSLSALVSVPPDVQEQDWEAALDEAAREMNTDARVTPADQ